MIITPPKYKRLHPLTQAEGLNLYLSWKKIPCIPTNYPVLDNILGGGLGVKQITSIVGFTGTGKSELARQIRNNIVFAGYNTIHIDAELGIHRLIERDLVQTTCIRPGILRKEEFSPKQKQIYTTACEKLTARTNLITLNPGGGIKLDKLFAKITEILDSFDNTHPTLIILDSVQRFSQGASGGDERIKLKRTMYALETYIHNINAALLLISEGRRPPKKKEEEDQTLEVFKSKASESNAVEFTTDTLIVLDQENAPNQFVKPLGDIPAIRKVRMILPKNRNGNEGFFEEKIYFKAPYWEMEIK